MGNQYYVILKRYEWGEDSVLLMDHQEAVKANWVDNNGDRVWVVPARCERCHTFVFPFKDLEAACLMYDAIHQELGIHVADERTMLTFREN